MLAIGQQLTLDVEKPVAGGRMIARSDGQVVLVAGAIPGERVVASVTRVAKGVAFADTLRIETASADRREPFTDPACAGTAFAHIEYPRQLTLKAEIVADGLARIGRLAPPAPIQVAASRVDGYRMRARLHRAGRRFGFFREGTHQACDARATRQLLDTTCDALDAVAERLHAIGASGVRDVEVSENVDATQRVVHLESSERLPVFEFRAAGEMPGITGVLITTPPGVGHAPETQLVAGDPHVVDRLTFSDVGVSFRRHVLAFFQGNRYLLPDFVTHVIEQVPVGRRAIDLYAGVGLFAVSAAASRCAHVVAVEGDALAARDLEVNGAGARGTDGRVDVIHRSVERYLASAPVTPDVVILDPPRTGMSPEALRGVMTLRAPRVVYVSCDVATLARDARQLVQGGYRVDRIAAFDLFPNTPHVETVMTLTLG